MNFKRIFLALIFNLFAISSFAHEGHDSATAKSLHGGIVKKTANTYVEVLQDEQIEIYISNHDYKNFITPKLEVSAFADIKGKKLPLKLESKGTHFIVATDLKKEKHFKLNVVIKNNKKDESAVFPLEN